MNNKEKILKYLSDLMSEDEKKNFENLLEQDESLKKEFEKIQDGLEVIKKAAEPEVNETYFVNLLPRARSRMNKEKKAFSFNPKWATSLAALVFLIISALFFSRSFESPFLTYKDFQTMLSANNLGEFDKTELDLFIDQNYYDFLNSTNLNASDFDIDFNALDIDSEGIKIEDVNTLPDEESYEIINELSEKDFNKIYNEIKKMSL